MGTTDEGFRQGMAGGFRRITLSKHAGQVPVVRKHHTQEQRHHTLRHTKRIKSQETGTHSQVPQRLHVFL